MKERYCTQICVTWVRMCALHNMHQHVITLCIHRCACGLLRMFTFACTTQVLRCLSTCSYGCECGQSCIERASLRNVCWHYTVPVPMCLSAIARTATTCVSALSHEASFTSPFRTRRLASSARVRKADTGRALPLTATSAQTAAATLCAHGV
jgi:hypothetical protein